MQHIIKPFHAYFLALVAIIVSYHPTEVNAGALKLTLKNINANDTLHSTDTPTGITTVDRPDLILRATAIAESSHQTQPSQVQIRKILSTGAAIAQERIISEDHPLDAHFELNVQRVDQESSLTELLPETFLARIKLTNATFKTQINGEDIIRQGAVDGGVFGADALGNTGNAGSNSVDLLIDNITNNPQTDFGLLLPLRIIGENNNSDASCNPVTVEVQLFIAVASSSTPFALGPPDSIALLSCEKSIEFAAEAKSINANFQQNFKTFISETYEPTLIANVGNYQLRLWPNLFDVKSSPSSEDRRMGFDDIQSHDFIVQFENLTGIQDINLLLGKTKTRIKGTIHRDENNVRFSIPGQTLITSQLLKFSDHPIIHSGHEITRLEETMVYGEIELVAFDKDAKKFTYIEELDSKGVAIIQKVPTGAGSIQDQSIYLIENTLHLRKPCKSVDGSINTESSIPSRINPKRQCTITIDDTLIGEINLTGESFGPFDWITERNHASIFRITNLPIMNSHGSMRTTLQGIMIIKNAAGNDIQPGENYDGYYDFELPFNLNIRGQGANGVYMLTIFTVKSILRKHGLSKGFGSADISFILHVPTPHHEGRQDKTKNLVIEMDRLMLNEGVLSSYGDNSNDVFSEHTVSGDVGRFGSKVPLKSKSIQPK